MEIPIFLFTQTCFSLIKGGRTSQPIPSCCSRVVLQWLYRSAVAFELQFEGSRIPLFKYVKISTGETSSWGLSLSTETSVMSKDYLNTNTECGLVTQGTQNGLSNGNTSAYNFYELCQLISVTQTVQIFFTKQPTELQKAGKAWLINFVLFRAGQHCSTWSSSSQLCQLDGRPLHGPGFNPHLSTTPLSLLSFSPLTCSLPHLAHPPRCHLSPGVIACLSFAVTAFSRRSVWAWRHQSRQGRDTILCNWPLWWRCRNCPN